MEDAGAQPRVGLKVREGECLRRFPVENRRSPQQNHTHDIVDCRRGSLAVSAGVAAGWGRKAADRHVRRCGRKECPVKHVVRALIPSIIVLAGCGKRDESLANRAGSKVGETLTDFASGIGKGIDRQMIVNVELSRNLADEGITKTISKAGGIGERSISVYLISEKPFKAKLIARALDRDGQEIGRSTADVELAADDAKYVTFSFYDEMDTQLVARYAIDLKE